MSKHYLLALIMVMATWSGPSFSAKFASQYCEFELPPGWECVLEGTEWLCMSNNKERQREAIIILAAKIRDGEDTLANYQAYLKKTKTFTLPGGKTQVSEPKYVKMTTIKDHQWVDAMHLASEAPGFYTRYLTTIKEDIGVGVTLSVAKDFYDSYQPVFDQIVKTLIVFRQKNVKFDYRPSKSDKDGAMLDQTTFVDTNQDMHDLNRQKKGGEAGQGDDMDLIMLLILLAVAGFAFYKFKKRKKSKKNKVKKSGGDKA